MNRLPTIAAFTLTMFALVLCLTVAAEGFTVAAEILAFVFWAALGATVLFAMVNADRDARESDRRFYR